MLMILLQAEEAVRSPEDGTRDHPPLDVVRLEGEVFFFEKDPTKFLLGFISLPQDSCIPEEVARHSLKVCMSDFGFIFPHSLEILSNGLYSKSPIY